MSNLPDPSWDYQQVWELIHDAMDLIVDAKTIIGECEESNNEVSEKVYGMLVDVSLKSTECSQILSAMTKENNE